jgi:hypothetical protein
MKAVDRTFGWLLIIGSLLHAYAAAVAYEGRSEMLLWALSGALAGLLLAALNLLRIGRPYDRALAWISFVGCIGWLAVVIGFGVAIGDVLDVRVVGMTFITLVLAVFSIQSALRIPVAAAS